MRTVQIPFALDVRTIYLMAGLVCLLSSLTVAVMRELHRPSRSAIDVLACALAAGGAALIAGGLHGIVPPWASGWLAQVCAGSCFALILESVRRLYGGRPALPVSLGAIGFLAIVVGLSPDADFPLYVTLTFQATCCTGAAWVAFAGEDDAAPIARLILGALFCGLALLAALRLGLVASHLVPLDDTARRFGPAQGVATLVFTLAPLLLVSTVLAIASARQVSTLAHQAGTDELTGAASRRFLFASAETWLGRHERPEAHTALMMIDIDHFKSVNDRFGHVTGDRVLRHVSDVLRRTLREDALVARYGGEEFCALVPVDNETQARTIAERLRRAVEATAYHDPEHTIPVTVSIGMALHRAGYTLQDVLRAADRRVYKAKTEGRNRIVAEESRLEMAVV
jgi:diguanylate cyclase (GGDEF)-like protein